MKRIGIVVILFLFMGGAFAVPPTTTVTTSLQNTQCTNVQLMGGTGSGDPPGCVSVSSPLQIVSGLLSMIAGQIPGTNTNGNASSGNVGEYIGATVTSGSPTTGITSGVAFNVTSWSLTAGDWDCRASLGYLMSGGGAFTQVSGWITTTSAGSAVSTNTSVVLDVVTRPANAGGALGLPPNRISLATTTTVYLVGAFVYASGTASAYGASGCRRMR